MRPTALLSFSSTVKTKLGAKTQPGNLQTHSENLAAACDAFSTAAALAASGSKVDRVTRDSRIVDLRAALEKLAIQVELVAAEQQNEALLLELGFQPRSAPSGRSFAPLGPAEILQLGRGRNTGTIQGKCRRMPGVQKFALEWSDDNGENWHNGTYSRGNTFQFEGLTPEKRYWVRALPLGSNNRKGSWSEPQTLFVL